MIIEPERIDWERLYRAAYPSVYRALVATLFDLELAADALQDAFLAGHVRMVSLESLRRVPIAASPIDELLDRMSVGQLLRHLTPRQRSIVVAYFYLDQTQEQIAELLGIRRGTVAATISQALTRMRKGEAHVPGTARPL